MADIGHKETDELIDAMTGRVDDIYRTAVADVQAKLDDYLQRLDVKDRTKRLQLARGEITQAEYNRWRTGQIMIGQRWAEMRDTLALDLHHANEIARSVVNGYMPEVYALNHDYATFTVEKAGHVDTSYTLYDRQTAERLLREEQILPEAGPSMKKRIAAGKDIAWQEGKIQSVTLQGILQGESIPNLSKRIAREMGESNHASTIRYARTASTASQNAGRLDAYKRAEDMGIEMQQTWVATLDGRTRHEHRILDGQTVPVGEPFEVDGYKIRYPGDPTAEGFLVWNCRCTTIAQLKGFERDVTDLGLRHDDNIEGMSYDEWKEARSVYEPITRQEEISEAMRERTIREDYIGGVRKRTGTSFVETLGTDTDSFGKVFKSDGAITWKELPDKPNADDIADRIGNTLARLQTEYPMQVGTPLEYSSCVQKVIVCDYDEAWRYLPDGLADRRLDNLATAQVFQNEIDGVNQAVVAFRREFIGSYETLEDSITRRAEAIASGRTMSSIGFLDAETTAIHEWGHVYSEHINTAMIYGSKSANDYWEWYKTLSKEEIASGISEYAATNRAEFEAECFLEMTMPNPRPIARQWWSFMERVLEEGY